MGKLGHLGGIALSLFFIESGMGIAEELVVKMRETTRIASEWEWPTCRYNMTSPLQLQQRCGVPEIANEAWQIMPSNGSWLFGNAFDLKNKYTFKVYTTGEIDKTVAGLQQSISELRENVAHNAQKLDDAERAILLQIDKLPTDLPANSAFYQQMRERLKADIVTDLEKAKN